MANKIHHTQLNLYDLFFANKKRKTYTNLGISLILIIILLIFALRPTILTIGKIRDKIRQYEDVNTKVEHKIEAAQSLAQQMTQSSEDTPFGLEQEITFMDSVFFQDANIKTFYKNIHDRADKNNVAIKNVSPKYTFSALNNNPNYVEFDQSPASPSTKYYEVSMSLEAKSLGDIEKFIQTVEGYEQNPIFSRVRSLTISNHLEESKVKGASSETKASDLTVVNCNMVMIVYIDDTRFVQDTKN
jgi:hypothetical protein